MHIMNARKKTNKYQNRIMPTEISSYAPFFQLVSQTPYFLLLVSIKIIVLAIIDYLMRSIPVYYPSSRGPSIFLGLCSHGNRYISSEFNLRV